MQQIKILVVDNSLTIRAVFEEILGKSTSFELVGSAANAQEAIAMIKRTLPDVVSLDINLPEGSGIEVLDEIATFWHRPSVVVVSSAAHQGSPVSHDALSHGAVACFDKSGLIAHADRLIALLQKAGSGTVRRAAFRDPIITLPEPAKVA